MPKLAQILGQSSGRKQVSLCVSVLFLFWSLYKTNGFHVAVSLFCNKSQRTSKCGKVWFLMVGMRYIKLPLFCVVLGFVFGLILSTLHSQWKAFEDPSLYVHGWVVQCPDCIGDNQYRKCTKIKSTRNIKIIVSWTEDHGHRKNHLPWQFSITWLG